MKTKNRLILDIVEIQTQINSLNILLNSKLIDLAKITRGETLCITSKKSEQEQTKNLPSFLKKPTLQEDEKDEN